MLIERNHDTDDMIVGVIGMDIKLDFLHVLMEDTFPLCSREDYR